MAAEVVGLTRYPKKGAPGVSLSEMKLVKGLGVEGDFRQGGERQVSLLPAEARRWMEAQPEQGLCFGRFRENITTKGLPTDTLGPGSLLSAGSAVLRTGAGRKECFDHCALFSAGAPCRLAGCAVFAAVEQSGTVRISDAVLILR